MPFLGKTPKQVELSSFGTRVKDDFTANGSTTAFTLSKSVANPNDIAVFVGNVRQEPTDAYTVNGTTLTMSEAPATGLNFYVVHTAGTIESSVVPADGSITGAKIEDNPTIAGKLGIGTSTHHDGSTKLTVAGRINTSNGTATGSINYGGGSVVNVGALTNHPVNLMVNNSTKWVIDTNGNLIAEGGGGIVLGNTSYAAANELDDYEEGSWTPQYTANQGLGGLTLTRNLARYIKIGNQVTVMGWIMADANYTVTTHSYITNLPFDPYATTSGLLRQGMGIWGSDDPGTSASQTNGFGTLGMCRAGYQNNTLTLYHLNGSISDNEFIFGCTYFVD